MIRWQIARRFASNPRSVIGFCTSLILTLCLAPPDATAAEPAVEFLTALRDRNYYDEAIDYLDSLQNSPSVPVELKEVLLYEQGATLVAGSKYKRDNALREKDLNLAQQALKQFLAEHPEHLKSMLARAELANVLVERGKSLAERAKKLPEKKAELLVQAKAQLEEGIAAFASLREDLKKKLESIPKILDDKKQAKLVEQRDHWREDYLHSMLLAAAAREELAEVYEPGSKEKNDTLDAATKEFGEIATKYRTRPAGLYGRLYQGRCLLKVKGLADKKNVKDALGYLNEVLGTPEGDATVRNLKMRTYVLATQAWLELEQYGDAVSKGGTWLDEIRPNEQRSDDVQEIRVNVAEACLKFANALKISDPASKEIKPTLRQGKEFATLAVKYADGNVKRKATELLPQFGSTGESATAAAEKEPKNFEEARDFGKEAIDSIPTAQSIARLVPPRIKVETDAKIREELEQQVKEAQETLITAKSRALQYFKIASRKATEETAVDDINQVRYFLCYLNYDAGNYFDSLALGEFLALRYPESAGARQGALIAMASCQKLYGEEKGEDKEFESRRIQKIAQYIVDKWPDQKEAEEALNTLIPFLIRAGRIDEAEKYVAQIPESSSYRGMAELKTGQALWANYLLGNKEVRELEKEQVQWEKDGYPEGQSAATVVADKQKLQAPLETLKKRAEETLADGVKRMQNAGQVNPIVANATLSLAQIYVDTNQAEKAVTLLEDPNIGALTLVGKQDPSVGREGLPEEIYKTALRAYISSLGSTANADATVTKAKSVMESLKKRLGTTPEGQQRLVLSYVGVAKDLQTQLEIASDEATRKNLAKGFEVFLKEVGKEASDYNILNWVGETFRRMGESFGRDKTTNKPTPEALAYYKEAVNTFQQILDKAAKDPKFLPTAAMKTGLQRQLAATYSDAEDYEKAAQAFIDLLAANPGLLNVQMEAAYNYQAWAGSNDKPETVKKYENAVNGYQDPKTRKVIVWGWTAMSNKVAGDSRFTAQFYEARYNLAYCRFKYALGQQKKDNHDKFVNFARLDIETTAKLFPDMGGAEWRPKFDKLLKNIQREQGEKVPRGLAALNLPPPTAPNSSGTIPTVSPAGSAPPSGAGASVSPPALPLNQGAATTTVASP